MPRKSNTAIKAYKKKDGKIYYMFKVYLGLDALTGKPQYTTRRGFRSLKELMKHTASYMRHG